MKTGIPTEKLHACGIGTDEDDPVSDDDDTKEAYWAAGIKDELPEESLKKVEKSLIKKHSLTDDFVQDLVDKVLSDDHTVVKPSGVDDLDMEGLADALEAEYALGPGPALPPAMPPGPPSDTTGSLTLGTSAFSELSDIEVITILTE